MEIKAFKSDKWVEIGDGFKVRVDYPTEEQRFKLEEIQTGNLKFDGETVDYSSVKLSDWNRYVRYYLKYTIKDWQGLTADGEEVKCIVKNNELEDSLWNVLVSNVNLTSLMYEKINECLKWDVEDKKK